MSTKETDKTVSVIVCTYNGEQYLREQLDSILLQTYPIRELIIQDDGRDGADCERIRSRTSSGESLPE